jgi:acyl carrier protein
MNIEINNLNHNEVKLIHLINRILPEPVDSSVILNDAELHELGLNSIGLVKLITEIEQSFNIEIDDEFLLPDNFNTYSKIKNAVFRLLKIEGFL